MMGTHFSLEVDLKDYTTFRYLLSEVLIATTYTNDTILVENYVYYLTTTCTIVINMCPNQVTTKAVELEDVSLFFTISQTNLLDCQWRI